MSYICIIIIFFSPRNLYRSRGNFLELGFQFNQDNDMFRININRLQFPHSNAVYVGENVVYQTLEQQGRCELESRCELCLR